MNEKNIWKLKRIDIRINMGTESVWMKLNKKLNKLLVAKKNKSLKVSGIKDIKIFKEYTKSIYLCFCESFDWIELKNKKKNDDSENAEKILLWKLKTNEK